MWCVAEVPVSADSLISTTYQHFQTVPDPRDLQTKASIPFTDLLMSGLAVFGLKFPSLLQYDLNRKILDKNLLNLYHISRPPSDTYLRERLDELDPFFVRPAFKKIFAQVQRGKCLERFEFLDGYYLLALDGTGEFSSSEVCCPQCCKKEHKDGTVTYYHQMLDIYHSAHWKDESSWKKNRPLCGAKCRDGHSCKAKVVVGSKTEKTINRRCRMHGGLSTGAKTQEGKDKCREAA